VADIPVVNPDNTMQQTALSVMLGRICDSLVDPFINTDGDSARSSTLRCSTWFGQAASDQHGLEECRITKR